jgi:hypothetical protein
MSKKSLNLIYTKTIMSIGKSISDKNIPININNKLFQILFSFLISYKHVIKQEIETYENTNCM